MRGGGGRYKSGRMVRQSYVRTLLLVVKDPTKLGLGADLAVGCDGEICGEIAATFSHCPGECFDILIALIRRLNSQGESPLSSGKLFWPILSRVSLILIGGLVAMYLVGVGLDHFNRPHFPGEAWAA